MGGEERGDTAKGRTKGCAGTWKDWMLGTPMTSTEISEA